MTEQFGMACDCEKALSAVVQGPNFRPLSAQGKKVLCGLAALGAALDEYMKGSGCDVERATILKGPLTAAHAVLVADAHSGMTWKAKPKRRGKAKR